MIFYIQYLLLLSLVAIAKLLPRRNFLAIGTFFGILAFWLLAGRRKLTIRNIQSTILPNNEEATEMAKKTFANFGSTAFEIIRNSGNVLTETELKEIFEGSENEISKLHKLYEQSGHKMLLITPHLGSFELVAQYIGLSGIPMSIIGRPTNNPYIARFIKNARELFNNSYIEKGSTLLGMAKAIKDGRVVGILPDQKGGGSHSAVLDFLGRPARTLLGTARLAKKFDCEIVPVFAITLPNRKVKLTVNDPLQFASSDSDEVIMQKVNNIICEKIVQYPEQWFWMHNRWKM